MKVPNACAQPLSSASAEASRCAGLPVQSTPQQGAAAPGGGASLAGTPTGAPAPASGLVFIKTSDTHALRTVEIDQKRGRLVRMRRSLLRCSEQIQRELGSKGYRLALLTLTYRDVDGYEPRHISELIKRIRHWFKRRRHRLHYVWVAELQERGALHYHVVIWLPRGLSLPMPDKQGWWPHGSTRIEQARSPVGYLLKYASKFDTKQELPYGVRLHGAGGLDETGKEIRRWHNLPAWLKSIAGVKSSFMRIKGLGLVERGTGVWVQSPWRVCCKARKVTAAEIFKYPRALANVGGPYSMLDGTVAADLWVDTTLLCGEVHDGTAAAIALQ